jgi:hypothetical protein
MSWPGKQSDKYMPLGFATFQDAGTIGRSNGSADDYAYPYVRDPSIYDPDFARSPPTTSGFTESPPSTFEVPHKQPSDNSSSSQTLLGGDYFQCTSF